MFGFFSVFGEKASYLALTLLWRKVREFFLGFRKKGEGEGKGKLSYPLMSAMFSSAEGPCCGVGALNSLQESL